MTMTVREMMGARAEKLARARELLQQTQDGARDLTAAEKREWDGLLREANLLGVEIDGETAADATYRGWRDPDWRSGGGLFRPEPEGGPAWRGMEQPGVQIIGRDARTGQDIRALGHGALLTTELRDRFNLPQTLQMQDLSVGRYVRAALTGRWSDAPAELELRALSGSLDTGGGYLLPDPLSAQWIDLARAQAVLSQAGSPTIPMDSASLDIIKLTSDPSAVWKRENSTTTEDTTTAFGRLIMHARTLICVVRSSLELIMDAENAAQILESAMAKQLGLRLDAAGLRGDGSQEYGWITGLRNYSGVNLVNALGTQIEYDWISRGVEAVRIDEGVPDAIVMHPRDAGNLDRRKSGEGEFLTPPPSYQALRRYFQTTQLPTDEGGGSNESVAILGDFNKVAIGLRMAITLEASRVADNAFRDAQILIRAILRADVAVLYPSHFAVIYGVGA